MGGTQVSAPTATERRAIRLKSSGGAASSEIALPPPRLLPRPRRQGSPPNRP